MSFTATGPTVAPRRPGRSGRGVLTRVTQCGPGRFGTLVPQTPGRPVRHPFLVTAHASTAAAGPRERALRAGPVLLGLTAALCAAAVLVDLQVPAAHRRAVELEPAWAACLAALVMAWAGATVLAAYPRHLVGWLLSAFGAVVGPRRPRLGVAGPRDVVRADPAGCVAGVRRLPAARCRAAPRAAPAPRPVPPRPAARGSVAGRRGHRARGDRPAARRAAHRAGPGRAGGRRGRAAARPAAGPRPRRGHPAAAGCRVRRACCGRPTCCSP